MAIVFLSGGVFVNQGLMTAGGVYAFYLIASNASTMFANLIEYFGSIRGAVGSMDRVLETLEAMEEAIDDGETVEAVDGDITLKNVSFAYREKDILKNLDCVIPSGKVTALVGANGCGKSTIFRLLERFYDTKEGSIMLGTVDAQGYSLRSWRNTFGYVPQECSVMGGTIRSNLSFGADRELTDAELEAACEKAGLKDLIATLPDGYDSHVAPGGTNFSGGQRQCLAIARAIIHDPKVLLLDEATSSMDAQTEDMVTSALRNLMEGRTTVIIAHDLKTILSADHAVVLKDGKVCSYGDPKQILNTITEYRDNIIKA